jgi:uncharacterized membrane protein
MTEIKPTLYKNNEKVQRCVDLMLKRKLAAEKQEEKLQQKLRKKQLKKLAKEMRNQKTSKSISKAAILERKERRYLKKQAIAIASSPDLSQMQAVRIDAKTVIFVTVGTDPETARKNHISKHLTQAI